MILFYNILMLMAAVLGLPLILLAILTSDKRRRTFPCRLGVKRFPVAVHLPEIGEKSKRAVWIHALSVGEVLSAVPLVEGLRERTGNIRIFLSVSTRTGYGVASQRLTGIADAIFFCPYDLVFSVRRTVNRINPALFIIVETDIWPNFLDEMNRRQVPVLLVNARLSRRTFSGYKRFGFFPRWLFSGIAKICVQTRLDAERFQGLGIPSGRIAVTGNVKFDQNDESVSEIQLAQWRRRLGIGAEKKVWLAGSTHEREEAVVRDVFIRLRRTPMDMTLIAVPRDPRRARRVARLFQEAGLATELVSQLSSPDRKRPTDVVIVDTVGDLRMLYALADMAFIGGSLRACGGHNPLEPAALSRPVLFGPDMSDFAEVARLLLESGGALQVRDAPELFAAVKFLMEDSLKAQEMGRRAYRVFCDNKGAVKRNLDIILNELSYQNGSGRHDGRRQQV